MKICYLADSKSPHTIRWCEHFLNKGYEISLISFKKECSISNIDFHYINAGNLSMRGGNWKVLLKIGQIKTIIKAINPDILHAHYATSYGIVGALSNFHPYIITSLGSDVLTSPKNSIIYKILLRFAFSKADWMTTMSEHMKDAISKIGNFTAKTEVVPFGIDPNLFNLENRSSDKGKFIITSTRMFEEVYNIPHLLKSISRIKNKIQNIELHLIGDGKKREELEEMARNMGIYNFTKFYGFVEQKKMIEILKKSNVFISVSLSDGNNISLNEAMACGCFPIATDIEANTQWIKHNINGFLVEINNVDQLAKLILEAYNKYDELSKRAIPINQNIIKEKANWYKNIEIVENKYIQLAHEK